MPNAPVEYRYPCESCGADLRFTPGEEVLTCPYCGHRQKIGAAKAPSDDAPHAVQRGTGNKLPLLREIPLREGLALAQNGNGLTETIRTLSCPNCGAKLDAAGDHHSSLCPFCATPVVTDTGATRQIKPQGVLPFVITQPQAKAALEKWLKGLWFAPNGLTQYARRGRQMTGVYSPFWTFDAETTTAYSGERGDWYYQTVYVTRTIDGKPQRVAEQRRYTKWTSVRSRIARSFDDVLVLASTSLPRRITDALTPWDLKQLREYQPEYLAGFEAEGYRIDLPQGHQIAREEMAAVIAMDVRHDMGGDEQRIHSIDSDFSAETFKHIMLPVWTAAYKYNGKSFRFVVNGQSGKVQGERPWSAWKLAGAAIMLIVIAAAFYYAGGKG